MKTKTYYGNFNLHHFVNYLASTFRDENLDVNTSRHGDKTVVRFRTSRFSRSGGQFAINVIVTEFEGGVKVLVQDPENLGVAASLGKTAIAALINPKNLFFRLDDLAQDIENITLDETLVKVIEQFMKINHLKIQLNHDLQRSTCPYCRVANEYGVSNCVACGAPMGDVQPFTCHQCGHLINKTYSTCPQCGSKL